MFFDERELHDCSFAKNCAAFFKISRSISSRAFSLRSRRSSAAIAPSPLGARPISDENFPTHPRIELGSTPKLLPASEIEYPCSLTSFTAETLNSREYFRRGIYAPLDSHYAVRRRAHHSWGIPKRFRAFLLVSPSPCLPFPPLLLL